MGLGKLIVYSGSSGVGKGHVKNIFECNPELKLKFSVSATTRPPRPGEENGEHYHFLTHEEFDKKVKNGEFLEWAEYAGNKYGTLNRYVHKLLEEGKNVLLEIEVEGVKQVLEQMPNCTTIWLDPPSEEELENRLKKRGTDSEESIKQRLEIARKERKEAKKLFKHKVVNDDAHKAAKEIEEIILGKQND